MKRLLLPSILITVMAGLSAVSWAAVNKRTLGDYDLHVRSLVVQPGDDAPTRTLLRGTGTATIAPQQATVQIDPLVNGDDSVTIDSSDPLHITRIRGVFAGKGAAAVQVGGTSADLNTHEVIRVRWSRVGPILRGAIVGRTDDGSVKLRTAVRGRITPSPPEVEPQ